MQSSHQYGIKEEKTRQNKTEQNRTKQNETEQNRTKQNKTEQNRVRVCGVERMTDGAIPPPRQQQARGVRVRAPCEGDAGHKPENNGKRGTEKDVKGVAAVWFLTLWRVFVCVFWFLVICFCC